MTPDSVPPDPVTADPVTSDPVPPDPVTPAVVPGEVVVGAEPVVLNADRDPVSLMVTNTGDRPVQVGSHYHFAVANPALDFDRDAAWGRRLNIAAGTAVRFEPGMSREVSLVQLAGRRRVPGLRLGSPASLDGDDVDGR